MSYSKKKYIKNYEIFYSNKLNKTILYNNPIFITDVKLIPIEEYREALQKNNTTGGNNKLIKVSVDDKKSGKRSNDLLDGKTDENRSGDNRRSDDNKRLVNNKRSYNESNISFSTQIKLPTEIKYDINLYENITYYANIKDLESISNIMYTKYEQSDKESAKQSDKEFAEQSDKESAEHKINYTSSKIEQCINTYKDICKSYSDNFESLIMLDNILAHINKIKESDILIIDFDVKSTSNAYVASILKQMYGYYYDKYSFYSQRYIIEYMKKKEWTLKANCYIVFNDNIVRIYGLLFGK